jgi:hypothetical protein
LEWSWKLKTTNETNNTPQILVISPQKTPSTYGDDSEIRKESYGNLFLTHGIAVLKGNLDFELNANSDSIV